MSDSEIPTSSARRNPGVKAAAAIGWRVALLCALTTSGVIIAVGSSQTYMATRVTQTTVVLSPSGKLVPGPSRVVVREISGWDYVSGSDNARPFYGFVSLFVGIIIAFLALITLVRLLSNKGQLALFITCAGLAALSILVTLVDLNLILDYRDQFSQRGDHYSVGRGLWVVLVGAVAALILSIASSLVSRSSPEDGPP